MNSRNAQPPPYHEFGGSQSATAAAPAPRAASVTSGRSGTRRHRHTRSHHGGSSSTSSHTSQNEFPVFALTGDVEIVISNESRTKENRYVLHRLILSQYSAFFEASTRDAWNRADDGRPGAGLPTIGEDDAGAGGSRASSRDRTSTSFEQVRKRWRYVLDWQNAGEDDTPMLMQETISPTSLFGGDTSSVRSFQSKTRPGPLTDQRFLRSTSNFSSMTLDDRPPISQPADPGDEVLKDYDNLFRTMYQFAPLLDTLNIATAYTECKALLNLADMYDALEIVGSRVDHHLLRFGSRLFKQIAKYPPSYLKLGYLARSRTIFTEALIHVVGQWPLAAPQLKHHIDAHVFDLILDKYDDLEDAKARVEGKLWRLNLTTSRGERVTPSNDYLGWLAVSLFRQWVAENTTASTAGILKDADTTTARAPNRASTQPPPPPRANSQASNHLASQRVPSTSSTQQPLSIGKVYLLLGSNSQSAYLGHDDLKRFLKLQPELYTRDNLRRFERRMEEVKHIARDSVRPLMRNYLELDLAAFGPAGLGYLTCTRLEDADLPWDD